MVEVWIVVALLVLHFVGDFVLQNSHMALRKGSDNLVLAAHALTYSIPFFIFGLIFYVSTGLPTFAWWFVNLLLHAFVDFNTSRLNSVLNKHEDKHWFFLGIGFDQLLHYLILLGTWVWLVK